MATQYEKAFITHCTIDASLRLVIEADLPVVVFADDQLRQIYEWTLDYWHSSAAPMAPSAEAMRVHFDAILREHEIEVEFEPGEVVEWAIEMVKGAYVDRMWQEWSRAFVTDMSMADLGSKAAVMEGHISDLLGISTSLARRSELVDLREGAQQRLDAYHQRAADIMDTTTRGLKLGLDQVDEHIGKIRPGDLAVFAGGPKMGKSYGLDMCALYHWKCGGTPVLFTLENSVEDTLDRIAIIELGLDPVRWARGLATPEEIALVEKWIETMQTSEHPLYVVQPEIGKRTVEYMVRLAKSLGDAVLIDQLTFIEVPQASMRKPRDQQVRDILHELKALVSTGNRIPCLLAHQINREGVKAAEKVGHIEMYHLAESSEVERTADLVFGLWAGDGLKAAGLAYLQMLASRHHALVNWELIWRPWIGQIAVRGQIDLRSSD